MLRRYRSHALWIQPPCLGSPICCHSGLLRYCFVQARCGLGLLDKNGIHRHGHAFIVHTVAAAIPNGILNAPREIPKVLLLSVFPIVAKLLRIRGDHCSTLPAHFLAQTAGCANREGVVWRVSVFRQSRA